MHRYDTGIVAHRHERKVINRWVPYRNRMDRTEDIMERNLASLAIEGLVPDQESIELAKKVLIGEMTADEAIAVIQSQHVRR